MSEDREQLLSLVNSCQDKIRELQQENKQLKRNIEIKNAYCQLIADLGFDYDGCKQANSLKDLIDELVKYALASRDNDDGLFVYEDGFNKKYNILNEELEGDK